MTYRGFLTRAEIGLRAPRSRSTNIDASRGGVTGHYAGKAQGVSTALSGHSKCLSLWRGYQNYHMDTHGWVDIAYSLGVCQHGYILAGRGANVRTGANGTDSGNAYWYAICWIGGGSEEPTQDARDAFWEAVRMLRRDGGAANRTNDHSAHKATACAGDPMRAIISAGETFVTDPDYDTEDDMPYSREELTDIMQDAIFKAGFGRTNPESFGDRVGYIRVDTRDTKALLVSVSNAVKALSAQVDAIADGDPATAHGCGEDVRAALAEAGEALAALDD